MRPFAFMVPFWGERYRAHFVDLCLPSLLAPNNLPVLSVVAGHRFLVATTRADWSAIERLPIMEKLGQYATPVLIEIDPPTSPTSPGSVSAILQQNACQRKLIEAAYADRGYGCMIWPDIMVSDGMVAAMVKHAEAGCQLVLCSALRQTEEAVLAELVGTGQLDADAPASLSAKPLVLPSRQAAGLCVRHLHSEVTSYDDAHGRFPLNPRRPFLPTYLYWHVPDRCGLIMHTFLYQPMLMDFGAIEKHDIACLEKDIFENVYVARNFPRMDRVHVVEDSDEFSIVSLTPEAVGQQSTIPRARWSRLFSSWTIRIAMGFHARFRRDPMKRDLFRYSVVWHAEDLDDVYRRKERDISNLVERAVGDYYQPKGAESFPAAFNVHSWLPDLFLIYFTAPDSSPLKRAVRTLMIFVRALTGNREAWAQIRRRSAP